VEFASGKAFVWVKGAGSFEKREIKTGPLSDVEVVVVSGLLEGDFVRRVSGEPQ